MHIAYNAYLHYTTSPLGHLALFRQRCTHNLVAVEQTQGVKCLFKLPHCIDGVLAQLMG